MFFSKKGSVHARRRKRLEEERQRHEQGITYQDGQDRFEMIVPKKDGKKKEDPRTDPPLDVSSVSLKYLIETSSN